MRAQCLCEVSVLYTIHTLSKGKVKRRSSKSTEKKDEKKQQTHYRRWRSLLLLRCITYVENRCLFNGFRLSATVTHHMKSLFPLLSLRKGKSRKANVLENAFFIVAINFLVMRWNYFVTDHTTVQHTTKTTDSIWMHLVLCARLTTHKERFLCACECLFKLSAHDKSQFVEVANATNSRIARECNGQKHATKRSATNSRRKSEEDEKTLCELLCSVSIH